jgi:hypothetical protein
MPWGGTSTIPSGYSTEIRYMVKYFAGPKGSVSFASNGAPAGVMSRAGAMLAAAAWCGPSGVITTR